MFFWACNDLTGQSLAGKGNWEILVFTMPPKKYIQMMLLQVMCLQLFQKQHPEIDEPVGQETIFLRE